MNPPRRAYLAVFLIALFFGPSLRAKEKPESVLAALPATIAGCQQKRPQNYGGKLGSSIDYDRESLHITVYAYDLGNAAIADGITDPAIREAFENAKQEIQFAVKKGIYSKAKALDDGTAKYGPGQEMLKATYKLTRTADGVDTEYYSEIQVYGARNYIIKLRISTTSIQDIEVAKTILRFVPELMEAIKQLPKNDAI